MLKIHSVVLIMVLSSLLITATLFSLQQTYMAMAQTMTTTMSSSSPTSQNQTKQIIVNDRLTTRLLADSLANRLNKTAAILEVTSLLPQVRNTPYANSISPVLHGIPQNLDSPKRAIAQHILSKYHDFDIVSFIMPNGNMYILEPYSQQAHLTKNNYAFRDYYKGAVGTHNTYLGGVIISTATGKKEAVISVPIYSNNSNQLVGIWAGDISLGAIEKSLQALNITTDNTTHNERVVFVDQNGKKVADSVKALSGKQNESFASLRSFKNAENGTAGSIVEQFNDTKMLITYQPAKMHSTTWAILLMRPVNDSVQLDKS
jgi:hypothetical protein